MAELKDAFRWLPPFAGAAVQGRELGEALAPDEGGDGQRVHADGREEGRAQGHGEDD